MLTRLPDVGSSELWLIDLDTPDVAAAECLSADEARRAARFVFARDSHRHIQAHIGLRRVLAATLSVGAESLAFDIAAAGKPSLRDHPDCRFNLSHSGHLALVAIDRQHEVGVDIELLRPVDDWLTLASEHFDASELSSVGNALDPALAFLCCWTRKEACLKAIGTGLNRDLRQVSTGCSTAPRLLSLAIDGARRSVAIESFVMGDAFVASLARLASPTSPATVSVEQLAPAATRDRRATT